MFKHAKPQLSPLGLPILILVTLAGCAPAQRTASVPAAPHAPSTTEAPNVEPTPAGQLACTTKDAFGVVTEVYLDDGRGTLRRLAPSGMSEEQPLRFERYKGALIGDHPVSADLAVHAVTLRQAEGRKFLRLGDWNQSWSACL